mgnify:CR=1 FL=1
MPRESEEDPLQRGSILLDIVQRPIDSLFRRKVSAISLSRADRPAHRLQVHIFHLRLHHFLLTRRVCQSNASTQRRNCTYSGNKTRNIRPDLRVDDVSFSVSQFHNVTMVVEIDQKLCKYTETALRVSEVQRRAPLYVLDSLALPPTASLEPKLSSRTSVSLSWDINIPPSASEAFFLTFFVCTTVNCQNDYACIEKQLGAGSPSCEMLQFKPDACGARS